MLFECGSARWGGERGSGVGKTNFNGLRCECLIESEDMTM